VRRARPGYIGGNRATEQQSNRGAGRLRGRRAREREPDADPLNLIRVMPAEGEMKHPTNTNQRYLGRAPNTPSHLRLLSRITAGGG